MVKSGREHVNTVFNRQVKRPKHDIQAVGLDPITQIQTCVEPW